MSVWMHALSVGPYRVYNLPLLLCYVTYISVHLFIILIITVYDKEECQSGSWNIDSKRDKR